MSVRIVRLQSENIKRLTAVDISPDASLDVVTIGGRNRAGKSSVLDSIMYALGGKDLVPAEPIRQGEAEGKIEVDLGELVVTRKFKRDKLYQCHSQEADLTHVHHAECPWVWTDTRSTLTVKLKESGAGYTSPQAVLDKLVGSLTFDPLSFVEDAKNKPKEAAATLRQLVGIDTTIIDELRKKAVMNRTAFKKRVDELTAQLAPLQRFESAPAEEISMEAVSAEMAEAERLRGIRDKATQEVSAARGYLSQVEKSAADAVTLVQDLEKRLTAARATVKTTQDSVIARQAVLEDALEKARLAADAVPDIETLKKRLTEVELMNRQVRGNKQLDALIEQRVHMNAKHAAEHENILKLDADKAALLENAKFPVPGLGVTDEAVVFNGLPFEQASTSEQLEASVAIGLALNPKLRVMLVRNGNVLDDESMEKLTLAAEKVDAQIWVEYVTSDPSDVAVMIEDGAVVS